MASAFKALFRPLRKLDWIDAGIRRLMEVWRQWPFVVPSGIVTCASDWIVRQQKSISWFSSRTSPWYREIYPEEKHVYPRRAIERGEKEIEFHTVRVWFTRACGLFYLHGAYVLAPDGAVMSPRGELFDEFSHDWNTGSLRSTRYFAPFATFSLRPKRIKHLVATVAVTGATNYYHWMFNLMPRFHLLESVFESVDYFMVPAIRLPFQQEGLDAVGVPREKIIQLEGREKYVCERIFVPSVGSHDGSAPRWAVDYLRRIFLPPAPQKPAGGRKIYIAREVVNKRTVLNEMEVRRVMTEHGFEVIAPHHLTIREQAALYAQASHLVGPHGAAFTNMVFSTDAVVAEIFAPTYTNVGSYYPLAATCGHRYDYFLGDPVVTANNGVATTIDLNRLSRWVAGLLK